ncbi:acyltransferase [Rhodopirellula sp.]|nr:acyltransferase [Rhodopirellula sp.]
MTKIIYRPEIDGLRAVAVMPVILFHLGFPYMPGGFLGVDVFFVISGFLITSIIWSEIKHETFTFREFWGRRVRRILPAMIFVSACTLLWSYLFAYRPDQQAIGKQGLAALLSVANIFFWRTTGDYWGTNSEESPFLHAWSLAVEEQFYLFFPLVFWLVFIWRSRWLKHGIAISVMASFLLFLWGQHFHPTATFYLLPTRVWELGVGCLLAVSVNQKANEKRRNGIISMVGLISIFLAYLFVKELSPSTGFAVLGTALIIKFGQNGLCNQLLSKIFFVHIGRISYSLYLWHWPVIVLGKQAGLDWDGKSDTAAVLAITYFLALGTYHFIEKPTRRQRGIVQPTLIAGTLVGLFALWIASIPRTYDTARYQSPKWIEYGCRPHWRPKTDGKFLDVIHTNTNYFTDAFISGGGIQLNCQTELPTIVVLGDSHATMWSNAIANIAKDSNVPIAFFAMDGGESPFFEIPIRASGGTHYLTSSEKYQYDSMRLEAIKNWNPKLIIIAARWFPFHFEESKSLLNHLRESGIFVLLIEDPPELSMPDKSALQFLAYKGLLDGRTVSFPTRNSIDEQKRKTVRDIAANYRNVELLPTYDLFKNEFGATVVLDNVPLYMDDDHLTSQGGELITQRLSERIQALLRQNEE